MTEIHNPAGGGEAQRESLTTPCVGIHDWRAVEDSMGLDKKRKLPGDCNDGPDQLGHPRPASLPPAYSVNKKIKLTKDVLPVGARVLNPSSRLAPEVWHHVFTFCPPKSLGNLLAVNKLFNRFLDPASPFPKDVRLRATSGALQPLEPNAIWQASRRRFWPQMPVPLQSKTELDMWRLACFSRCQGCGKVSSQQPPSFPDPRRPGPGTGGVAIIWAFGRRLCASCLLTQSYKELDLQILPTIPSAIIPALPFVYLTQDCDVFSAPTYEHGLTEPTSRATKLFLKSDVEALEAEFRQVLAMGQGTLNEWLKGLNGRGKELLQEAFKWEKWEFSGGTFKMRALLYPGLKQKHENSATPRDPERHGRTAEEAAQLKVARKREIERRALLLDPPITPDVLSHMPSFQAATQIVAELGDDAWELLKPRLLAQRADAELLASQGMLRDDGHVQAQQDPPEKRPIETTRAAQKEERDRIDREWEEAQGPLRAKIAGYADEAVRDRWSKVKNRTRENCARFAIDVLLHVRKRFYEHVSHEAAAAKAAGRMPVKDPANGPFTQKLTLENMKWIFDTKVKQLIQKSLHKVLFYCSGCEATHKPFAFEGALQHFAALHTTALSKGNIVVYWRAEWPEQPPFSASIQPVRQTRPTFAAPAPTVTPSTGHEYNPSVYNGHFSAGPPPYQLQPTAPPFFTPQIGYELQPSSAPPPAPYPVLQPPPVPYAPAVAVPVGGHVWRQDGQLGHHHEQSWENSAGRPGAHNSPPGRHALKIKDLAATSRTMWRALGQIQGIPRDIRIFATIHHVADVFRFRFKEALPLSLFIDGLSTRSTLRPILHANGLVCKACRLGLGSASSVGQESSQYSLTNLAHHFQSEHIEHTQSTASSRPLNWVVDMWPRHPVFSLIRDVDERMQIRKQPMRGSMTASLRCTQGIWGMRSSSMKLLLDGLMTRLATGARSHNP
ncbi:hypothetical protein VTJ49DRAFT_6981 [Mycothermus thermophilus]|uniref:DUF7892 domain-containing protein n=1 Tax=Humicola insolens TaxID=85995 RepID=A0ABR3VI49_HUMIN